VVVVGVVGPAVVGVVVVGVVGPAVVGVVVVGVVGPAVVGVVVVGVVGPAVVVAESGTGPAGREAWAPAGAFVAPVAAPTPTVTTKAAGVDAGSDSAADAVPTASHPEQKTNTVKAAARRGRLPVSVAVIRWSWRAEDGRCESQVGCDG
jgi:hypothetical protein